MTEQDFRDKYYSIMNKVLKLEKDNPNNWGIVTISGIAVGATIYIISKIGCTLTLNNDDKNFILTHNLRVNYHTQNDPSNKLSMDKIDLNYAYSMLSKIENGLDSTDKAVALIKEIDKEFNRQRWGKIWNG